MKEQLASIVIALIFSILGAILNVIWPEQFRIIDSLYIGLFAYLTATSAIVLWNTSKLKQFDVLVSESKFIANHLRVQEAVIKKGTRSFDLFWSLSLLRAKEGIYKILESGDFLVGREQSPNFWLQAVINTDSSWLSTNVVHTEQDWNNGWEYKGVLYQKLGIDLSNITVKRIFNFDSIEDITEDMVSMMKSHQGNNIQVKWITKDSDNLQWSPFQSFERIANTSDFAIIDSNYLLLFMLGEHKELKEVKCTRNENMIYNISNLYTRLWEQSKTLNDLQTKT